MLLGRYAGWLGGLCPVADQNKYVQYTRYAGLSSWELQNNFAGHQDDLHKMSGRV